MELTAGETGMFRKSAVVLALLLLSLSYRLYALGLGEIEMHSALNQPMSADISLISATGVDLSEVKITLASRAAHERLGLTRAKILGDFSFAIAEDSRGRPLIHISSTELIQEPYLEFLLEMVWKNGQIIREYTVLVDPPVTMQARPAVPVAPVARTPQPAPVIEPVRQAVPAPAPRSVRPAYVPAPVEKQAVQHYGPVRRDETLWSLAKNLRPSADIGIEQMMIALQRANPDAFADNNINNLHAGVTLKVPDRDAILALSKRQARAEARQQYKEWNDKRNAAKTVAKQPVAEMPAREEEMPVQQDGAIVETEALLKLPPPEGEMVEGAASGSESGDPDSEASGAGDIHQQLVLASEEVEAGRAQSEELQSRVQELEAQVQKMQRLIELKSEELAGMQNEAGTPEAEVVVSEEMPAGEEQQSAEEAEVEVAVTEESPVAEPRSSIVDKLMDNPVLAGLGVLIVMLLGGFIWGSMRKHRSEGLFDDEMTLDKHLTNAGEDVSSSLGMKINDPGEFGEVSSAETASHASDDMNDPVTEADVYLAYGRIQQAEDVLQAALQDDPENVAIRAKLLRVYHAAGNAEAFNSAAGEFRELVAADDEDGHWQRIAALGNELSPGNALYGSGYETPAEQDNVVEFDMDLSEPEDVSLQSEEIAEVDAAVQELDIEEIAGADTTVQGLEMDAESVEMEILPESIEFTLDDEDEYENENEGLLASADEVATKLDLARAYLDMEDPDGARSILQEVIDEGDEEQKSEAQSLISKIA